MIKLEELIHRLYPNNFITIEIGEVVKFINGRAYKQEELLQKGKYKVIRVGNFFTNDSWYYSNLELDKDKYCVEGDLLYTWAASIGPQIWNNKKAIYHYHIWKINFDESIIKKKYLFYFLENDVVYIRKSLTNSTMPHVSMQNMMKRIIVLPPISVQQEIVRILDKFTELTGNLTAELTARKRQYDYYKNTLFSNLDLCINEEIQMVKLKDVCKEFIVPMRDRPKIFDGVIPWCRIEDIEGKVLNTSKSGLFVSDQIIREMNLKVYPTGTVICSCSATIGVNAITTQPLITNQTFIGLVCGSRIINRYLLYYMDTQIDKLITLSNSGTIPYISRKKYEELEIKLPSLETQQRIVDILDKFDKLVNDISEGIPAEIAARQKQYEYYRDKLLTFKEVGNESI